MRLSLLNLLPFALLACSSSPSAAPEPSNGDDAGETACSPDLQTDGENCGACGVSCGGGACTAGVCGPAVVATLGPDTIPTGLVVSGDTVVWGDTNRKNQGHLFVCSASDCEGTRRTLSDRVAVPSRLGLQNGFVYFTSPMFVTAGGAVTSNAPARMALDGDGTPEFLVAALLMKDRGTTGFAVDARGVALAIGDEVDRATGGMIGQCALTGCPGSGTSIKVLEQELPVPGELVVTDGEVFASIAGNGKIMRYARTGGAKTVLFEAEIAGPLAQDDTDLAWGTIVPESTTPGVTVKNYVAVGPKAGGARTKVAETGQVTGVTLANGWVYWADMTGTLARVRKDGTDPQVLATGDTAWDLQVQGDWLWFSSPSAGAIRRLRLPAE